MEQQPESLEVPLDEAALPSATDTDPKDHPNKRRSNKLLFFRRLPLGVVVNRQQRNEKENDKNHKKQEKHCNKKKTARHFFGGKKQQKDKHGPPVLSVQFPVAADPQNHNKTMLRRKNKPTRKLQSVLKPSSYPTPTVNENAPSIQTRSPQPSIDHRGPERSTPIVDEERLHNNHVVHAMRRSLSSDQHSRNSSSSQVIEFLTSGGTSQRSTSWTSSDTKNRHARSRSEASSLVQSSSNGSRSKEETTPDQENEDDDASSTTGSSVSGSPSKQSVAASSHCGGHHHKVCGSVDEDDDMSPNKPKGLSPGSYRLPSPQETTNLLVSMHEAVNSGFQQLWGYVTTTTDKEHNSPTTGLLLSGTTALPMALVSSCLSCHQDTSGQTPQTTRGEEESIIVEGDSGASELKPRNLAAEPTSPTLPKVPSKETLLEFHSETGNISESTSVRATTLAPPSQQSKAAAPVTSASSKKRIPNRKLAKRRNASPPQHFDWVQYNAVVHTPNAKPQPKQSKQPIVVAQFDPNDNPTQQQTTSAKPSIKDDGESSSSSCDSESAMCDQDSFQHHHHHDDDEEAPKDVVTAEEDDEDLSSRGNPNGYLPAAIMASAPRSSDKKTSAKKESTSSSAGNNKTVDKAKTKDVDNNNNIFGGGISWVEHGAQESNNNKTPQNGVLGLRLNLHKRDSNRSLASLLTMSTMNDGTPVGGSTNVSPAPPASEQPPPKTTATAESTPSPLGLFLDDLEEESQTDSQLFWSLPIGGKAQPPIDKLANDSKGKPAATTTTPDTEAASTVTPFSVVSWIREADDVLVQTLANMGTHDDSHDTPQMTEGHSSYYSGEDDDASDDREESFVSKESRPVILFEAFTVDTEERTDFSGYDDGEEDDDEEDGSRGPETLQDMAQELVHGSWVADECEDNMASFLSKSNMSIPLDPADMGLLPKKRSPQKKPMLPPAPTMTKCAKAMKQVRAAGHNKKTNHSVMSSPGDPILLMQDTYKAWTHQPRPPNSNKSQPQEPPTSTSSSPVEL